MTRFLCSRALLGLFSLTASLVASPISAADLRDTIDAEVSAVWQREKLAPAAPASDAEFLRRVSLDLTGLIPTHDEASAFLADRSPEKRKGLIDRLLADPRYAQHQADLWDLVLFGRHPPGYDTDKRGGIQRWLVQQFEQNRPYDVWVSELLRAEGNSVEQGPATYFLQYRNQPEDLTEVVTQTFLGVQLQCARCHDHPFDSWKQTEFYGMAAFFARLELVQVGKKENVSMYMVGEKNTGEVLFTGPAKDQKPGQKGEPIQPKFLLGEALVDPPLPEGYKEVKFKENEPPPAPLYSRKAKLVDWITRTENPFFARAITNRLWAQYMGHGLVHPIDNLSPHNEPSHPALLDAMTQWLVEHKFDLQALTRELVNSQTYQLSSAGATGEPLPIWFQHARTRPLSAEELAESWRRATGYDTVQQGKPPEKDQKPSRFRPLERDYVLRFFGQPNNGVGDFQGGLDEHLYLNNGQLGSLLVSDPGGLLADVKSTDRPLTERVDRLFVQVLSRQPDEEERAKVIEWFTEEKPPEGRWRNVVWALMTCSEFRFNH